MIYLITRNRETFECDVRVGRHLAQRLFDRAGRVLP